MWSSGQGHFSAVKNLDPGRSSVYSAYGSDPPLLKVSIIKGAGEGLICHRPKSTNVFIVGEGWVQGVNYKRGRGGADLFAIDQNPRMYLLSETLRVG